MCLEMADVFFKILKKVMPNLYFQQEYGDTNYNYYKDRQKGKQMATKRLVLLPSDNLEYRIIKYFRGP